MVRLNIPSLPNIPTHSVTQPIDHATHVNLSWNLKDRTTSSINLQSRNTYIVRFQTMMVKRFRLDFVGT